MGTAAAKLLMDRFGAKRIAEIPLSDLSYSVVAEEGIIRLPRIEFYASKAAGRDVIIVVGDDLPPGARSEDRYELCGRILDLLERLGCSEVVTVNGMRGEETGRVYVAGSGASEGEGGQRIVGAAGVLLGLAGIRGIRGRCVLVTTSTPQAEDEKAGHVAYRAVAERLGVG